MSDSEKNTTALFSEFKPTKTEEWEKVLTRDLKGADYKKKLTWESIEGFDALPFYREEDLKNLPHINNGSEINTPADWKFCEVIDRSAPAEANKLAKQALESGADSLWFTIHIDPDDGMLGGDISGTHVQNLQDLRTLLDGIDLEKTGVVFNSSVGSIGLLGMVSALLDESKEYSNKTTSETFSFLFDPFTYIAGHGRLPLPEDQMNSMISQMADEKASQTLAADGAFYHNCGATIVQELGIALSIGSEYLARVAEGQKEQAAKKVWLHLSAGSLYFPEIAKFRAARLLWSRVLDGYDIQSRIPLTIHASGSKWNKAIADPHNNVLRATTESAAAAVGGANRITVHPYNAPFEQTDNFSHRIARNVSHILDEEAHFSAVDNPGDGSYFIEVLTDEIAKKAWKFFQMIEKQGGFKKALEGSIIQTEVGKSRKTKEHALATRELVMTGVNHYPDAGQDLPNDLYRSTPVDSLQQSDFEPEIDSEHIIDSLSEAYRENATLGDVVTSFLKPQKQLYPALKTYRAAKPFEEIRLRTQQFAGSRGRKVTAQLIPIGNKKMRKARATFSQNYLECAGFHVESHIGFNSVKDASSEIDSKNVDMYVLCGSDDEYPELISNFCTEFGKNSVLILAGYPKDKIDEYKNSGIDFFIYSGSDLLETLTQIQKKLGIGS